MYKHGTYTQRDVPPSDGANGGDLFAKQSHQRMRHPQLRPSVTSKSGDQVGRNLRSDGAQDLARISSSGKDRKSVRFKKKIESPKELAEEKVERFLIVDG